MIATSYPMQSQQSFVEDLVMEIKNIPLLRELNDKELLVPWANNSFTCK